MCLFIKINRLKRLSPKYQFDFKVSVCKNICSNISYGKREIERRKERESNYDVTIADVLARVHLRVIRKQTRLAGFSRNRALVLLKAVS